MAYDFGSQTLGIKNPFKVEGLFRTIAGLLVVLGALYPLLQVSASLKEDKVAGWTFAILGFILLTVGIRHAGIGIFQLFRYFVGRSVPSSLAYNYSASEREVAEQEAKTGSLKYKAEQLHSMLMGRKNSTFIEPQGWIARLVHTIFPKLTFLPYPLRNLAQELAAMSINVLVALVAFAVSAFVVKTGMAGEAAKVVVLPILVLVLLIYLLVSWRKAAGSIIANRGANLHESGGLSFGVIIALALLVPVIAGIYLDDYLPVSLEQLNQFAESDAIFSAWGNLALLVFAIVLVVAAVIPVLLKRMTEVTPSTEVSEYRDNMQESVHPNEIFINIENIVLANRRYREIPNRIYRDFDPELKEQAEGKGSFNGELIIETQPALADENGITRHKGLKSALSLTSEVAFLLGMLVFYFFGQALSLMISQISSMDLSHTSQSQVMTFLPVLNSALFTLFAWLTISAAAIVLAKASHLFWGEMHFNSLLMYMKTAGTFTESKISTGMAIHDSTRSENTVVRSSITPWVITSRIRSTTFATSGIRNLESVRYIMGMNKNEEELAGIVGEIKSFLSGREAIASITNEKDLDNASQIFQVNQQTRSIGQRENEQLTNKDEEAAGYLRNAQEAEDK